MKSIAKLAALLYVVSTYTVGFADDLVEFEARMQKAIATYESCFAGHRYTLVGDKDTNTIEFNSASPLIARVVQEYSFKGGRKVRFGHYFSEPLSQHFTAKQQANPAQPETDSTIFGVIFLDDTVLAKSIGELVPYFYFSPAKSLMEIYSESHRSATPNNSEMRFEHTSGIVTLCEIDSRDLLTRITQAIRPGNQLADGSEAPKGTDTEITLRLKWSEEPLPAVTEISTEVKINGSVKGRGSVIVKDRTPLGSPLGTLISLDGFGLKDGDEVTCEALPGRFFQFIDGRVVAVADSKALSAARSSRWRNNLVGSAFYYSFFALLLLGIGGFILWKRR